MIFTIVKIYNLRHKTKDDSAQAPEYWNIGMHTNICISLQQHLNTKD